MARAKVIIVTGTPGTGKTRLAKGLAKELGYSYVDISEVVEREKLGDAYDKKRGCKIVDAKKLSKALVKKIKGAKKNLVIDGHLSHYLPAKWVDACIVTICGLKELKKRLEAKGYNAGKARENMECEILDVCLVEAKEQGHRIIEVDTTKGYNIQEVVKRIRHKI